MSESSSKYMGVLCAILCGLCYTAFNAIVALIKTASIPEIVMIRGLVQLVLLVPLFAVYRFRFDVRGVKGSRLLLWIAALVHTVTLALEFVAVQNLPFGNAMTIMFSSPVVVMVIGSACLKEPCGIYKTLIICLFVAGILLIMKPFGLREILLPASSSSEEEMAIEAELSSSEIYGYAAAFTSIFGTAINTLMRKKLCLTIHYSIIIFSCSVACVLLPLLCLPIKGAFPLPTDWNDIPYSILVGVFGIAATAFFMQSLQRVSAGMTTIAMSLKIVFAYVVQVTLFDDPVDAASVAGAIAVTLCVIFITFEENIIKLLTNCFCKTTKEPESQPLVKENLKDEELGSIAE